MNNQSVQFILDERKILEHNEIIYQYDYLTLKFTYKIENIKEFIKEQFAMQGIEDVEYKEQRRDTGRKEKKAWNSLKKHQ